MESLARGIASTFVAYTIHYTASHLYSSTCVPLGFMGFFQGFLAVGSPICKATQTIADATSTSYTTLIATGVSRLLVDIALTGTGGNTPHKTLPA